MNQNEPLKPKTEVLEFQVLTGFAVYKVEELPGDDIYFTFRNGRGVECGMLYTGRELYLTEPYGIDSKGCSRKVLAIAQQIAHSSQSAYSPMCTASNTLLLISIPCISFQFLSLHRSSKHVIIPAYPILC